MGDDLRPNEITELLGCEPTTSHAKGSVVRGSKARRTYLKKCGMWRLEASDKKPENLDEQVQEILGKLTQDLGMWAKLNERFKIDLFCGLFMCHTNERCSISPKTLLVLGQRGIELGFDIYAPDQDLGNDDPCPCGSGEIYGKCCMPQASAGKNG